MLVALLNASVLLLGADDERTRLLKVGGRLCRYDRTVHLQIKLNKAVLQEIVLLLVTQKDAAVGIASQNSMMRMEGL